MRDDRERLLDIHEAILKIERYAARGREAAETDELLQVWFLHHLQLIGEAARGLSEDLRLRHREVPWAVIVATRNVLVHQYFGIGLEEVWLAIQRDVPVLKRNVEAILDSMA